MTLFFASRMSDRVRGVRLFGSPVLALVGTLSLGIVSGCFIAGCGGSASETPWPVEPDNIDLGPAGETRRDEDLTKKPDDKAEKAPETPPAKVKKVDPAAP